MNYSPLVALAFLVGLFISLWLLVLADIVRRRILLRGATSKAYATVLSRHKQDRISWNDYYLSLSFQTLDEKTVYCPNHAVTRQVYHESKWLKEVTVVYVPHEPRQCLLQSQVPYETRTNQWLLVVFVLGIISIVSLMELFFASLLLTIQRRDTNGGARDVICSLILCISMLSWGIYGSFRIIHWKPSCGSDAKDPYYKEATIVSKSITDYDSV